MQIRYLHFFLTKTSFYYYKLLILYNLSFYLPRPLPQTHPSPSAGSHRLGLYLNRKPSRRPGFRPTCQAPRPPRPRRGRLPSSAPQPALAIAGGPSLAAPPCGPFPVGQGRLRGGAAPARSAPPAAAQCRHSGELGAATDTGPAATGPAGIATASGRGPQRRRREAAAAGTKAAAEAVVGVSAAAAAAEEEAPPEVAAGSREARAPEPERG